MSSIRYLKEITTPEQICNNPLNTSVTKQQYSFPHSSRFRLNAKNSLCKAGFYDVNEKNFKQFRTTSLGKGNKFDFTKNGKGIPASNTYYPKNYTIEKGDGKRYTFGLARETAPQNGCNSNLKSSALIPGPGAYTPLEMKTTRSVSFHIKTKSVHQFQNSLGPGQYNYYNTIEPSKNLLVSKYKSTHNIKINPVTVLDKSYTDRAKRADSNGRTKDENPESLLARDKNYQINKLGHFFNTKYKDSKCRSFGKENRYRKFEMSEYPGPGNYLLPSDFGIYQSSSYTNR